MESSAAVPSDNEHKPDTAQPPSPPTERLMEYHDVNDLHISMTNVRFGKKPPDIADLLPSVIASGVLQPLLIRIEPEGPGVVAGRRRYFSACAAAKALNTTFRVPTILLQPDEDAEAVEASLLENVARQAMDPISEYEAYNRLVKEGKSIEDIALTFNTKPIQVRQRLAIATLHPAIRKAFVNEDVDDQSLELLAIASKAQQRDWLALFKKGNHPRGWQLREWLFGGDINPDVAIFDVEASGLSIVEDLFGDARLFADANAFWACQRAAVEDVKAELIAGGWSGVSVIDRDKYFQSWDYEKIKKKDGGKAFIEIQHDGSVKYHKGYLSKAEVKKHARRNAESGGTDSVDDVTDAPARCEITAALQNYLEYHRHAAVRSQLLGQPGIALRLITATVMCGSPLWHGEADPERYANETVAASVTASVAHAAFCAAREDAKALLRNSKGETLVRRWDGISAAEAFVQLVALTDDQVMTLLTVVAAETLHAGGELVELLGNHMALDMAQYWTPEPALLELTRDKSVLLAMLTEVESKAVAKEHTNSTGKVMKAAIQSALDSGVSWLPRYLQFPFKSYGSDHGIGIARAWKPVRKLLPK